MNSNMKKVTVLLFMVLIYSGAMAQLELGLRGGLNFNSNSVDIASNGGSPTSIRDSKTGFHFGAYASINAGLFSIQPEAYYSVQGADVTLASATGAISSNYLQIPILVRLDFLNKFNIHVGPQYGVLLKNEIDVNGTVTNLKESSKNGDFSVMLGLGMDLLTNLNVTLRYVKGFTDIVDESVVGGPDHLKNAMFQVSIGYALTGR